MTWSQLSIGAGIPPTTRNAAFRKFARIIPENLENSRSNIEHDRYHRAYDRRMAKIGFPADFPQISRSGIPDFPRCNPYRIKENVNSEK